MEETNHTVSYTEDNIRHLSDMEHVRTRPGMYIGRLGDGSHIEDGIYVLLKEIIDNSIDEFRMGVGKRIDVNVEDDLRVSVRDYGRGIPLGKLVEAVSMLNTGGKYDTKAFKKSVGLNGVGSKAVNALSARFEVRSVRDGEMRFVSAVLGCVAYTRESTDGAVLVIANRNEHDIVYNLHENWHFARECLHESPVTSCVRVGAMDCAVLDAGC